jgi:hypothetical protein
VLRWRYDPELDRVAFKLYVPGEESTAAIRLMTGAELVALCDDTATRHRVLASLRRMVECRLAVSRESPADAELVAVLGLDSEAPGP